jgi:Ni/Fe-hydrogenase 1 B-type cytochrome subunit
MNSEGVAATATPERPASPSYRWVYLWHWPIRAMHWLAVGSIVVLVITGFYIGQPYFITSGQASSHYLMGWMRFTHFAAAGVLVATAIVRAYWLFAGNKFERARALFPIRPRDWVNLWRTIKHYLMIRPEKAPHYLGHNPLQQLSYTFLYFVAFVQVVTGFALYGLYNPAGAFARFFGWVVPLFHGAQVVRFVHHIDTWIFLIFIPIHIYLALRSDVMEREGTMSSIFSGGRFVRSDVTYVDE